MDRLLTAPDPLVHSVLVALCDDDKIQARALRYLTELQNYASRIGAAGAAGGSGVANASASQTADAKRKASALEPAQLCIQCKSAFSPGDNSPTACCYHDGELQVNNEHSTWDDWEEERFGLRETSDNQEEYPDGFTWSCCESMGTSEGCTKGYHLAVRREPSKRYHMHLEPQPESSENRMFEGRVLRANEFVNESLESDDSAPGFAALNQSTATTDHRAPSDDGGDSDDGLGSEDTQRDSEDSE